MPRKWCEFTALADEGRAEIMILDYIGAWGYRTADFVRDLRELGPVGQIDVTVSSNGGDPMTAFAVAELMRAHKATVVTHVIGLAASAASIIAIAGDEVLIGADSFLMIHDAMADLGLGGFYGSDDLRALAEGLEKIQGQIIAFYARESGQSEEHVRELMAATTYMTAEEAVEMGFADGIEEPALKAVALDLSGFENLPAGLAGFAARGDAAQSVEKEIDMTEKTKAGPDPVIEKTDAPPAVDAAKLQAEARAEGEKAAMARVTEIMELCALAGAPGEAGGFIAGDKPLADIRRELMTARAAAGADEIDTRQNGGAGRGAGVDWAAAYKAKTGDASTSTNMRF